MRYLVIAAVLVLATGGSAQALPDFINGGFEDGTFNGWTTSGQTNITNIGLDPRTNTALQMVAVGLHSARVGDEDAYGYIGDQYSQISQSETVAATDLQHLYFAWAAVGLVPTNDYPHSDSETPYFKVELNWHPQGGGTVVLHSEEFVTGNIGSITPGWLPGAVHNPSLGENAAGIWYYRPWNVFEFDLSTYGIAVGDDLEAVLTTRDCVPSAHASYAYLDGFGSTPPGIPPIPEPSTLILLGLGLLGVLGGSSIVRRRT